MKAANSTCLRCHFIFPRYTMHQYRYTEHSGYSWSWAKNSNRRDYYTTKNAWLCHSCYQITREEEKHENRLVLYWSIGGIILIFLLLFFLSNK